MAISPAAKASYYATRFPMLTAWQWFKQLGGTFSSGGGGTTRALKFNVAANSQYIPVIGA